LISEFSLQGADGILVPGGFGDRGVQGKILAAKYAREKNVPYLGICLGMQIAVVEFARHVMNLTDANSTEFDPDTKTPCVIFMPEVIVCEWLCILVDFTYTDCHRDFDGNRAMFCQSDTNQHGTLFCFRVPKHIWVQRCA